MSKRSKARRARSNPEMIPPVTIDQVELYTALGVLKHAADMKTHMPVLSHVLLEGASGEVLATTTDLRCALSVLLRGDGEGSYCLPVKQLAALTEPEEKPKKGKARPVTDVRLYVDPEDMRLRHEDYKAELTRYKERLEKYRAAKIEAEKAKVTYVAGYGSVDTPPSKPSPSMFKTRIETPDLKGSLIGLPANDFPNRPRVRWEKTTTIDIEEALDAFDWVMPAVSPDEGLKHQNSMLVDPAEGLVATDGHRLHKAPFHYTGERMQTPLAGLAHLMRLMKLAKRGEVLVSNGAVPFTTAKGESKPKPFVRFDLPPWSLVVALVDPRTDPFPPFKKVIPDYARARSSTIVMRVKGERVAATVKRLQKIVEGAIYLTVDPVAPVVRWGCDSPDAAGAAIETPVKFSQRDIAEPARYGFNGRYVIDAMLGMGEEATISFAGLTDGVRIDGDNGRLAIVMPVRL